MIKSALNKLKKLNNNLRFSYLKYCKLDIDDRLVLLEGGQGNNINGNMFSMLNELESNGKFVKFKAVFVVSESTVDEARQRLDFYGMRDVTLVIRNSRDYCRYLATAKYLMTDNSFPPYFNKRNGQIFLNTWHGTPLKTLGKSDKSNLASLANIQKNYLMCDYALFPNEYTKNIFMQDYDLRDIFAGKSLIANYPRNYIFYDNENGAELKADLGFSGKQLFAYMPTWRGIGRTADVDTQLDETKQLLESFDNSLNDDQFLLVNLHFMLASRIDCSEYKHIAAFPSEYDTYEVVNACDGLITDYSSVFYDFAVTGRKIILFAYDKKKYLMQRGIYVPFESLPFPILDTVEDVVCEMSKPVEPYDDFITEYCSNGSIRICEQLFDMMLGKDVDIPVTQQHTPASRLCLLYAGTMPEIHFENIKNYINDNPEYKFVIAYRKNFNKANKEFVNSLSSDVSTLGIINAFQMMPKELLSLAVCYLFKRSDKRLTAFFEREAGRLFYGIKPDMVVDFSCGNLVMAGIINCLSQHKINIEHGDYFALSSRFQRKQQRVIDFEAANGFETVDYSQRENQFYITANDGELADESFRKNSSMKNLLPLYIKRKSIMKCVSFFVFKTPVAISLSDTYITVGDNSYKPRFIADKKRQSKHHFGIYSYKIPLEDVVDMPATNMVALCYKNKYNKVVQCHIIFNAVFGHMFFGLRGPISLEKKSNTVAVFRQSKNNRLNVYVRSWIKSDLPVERLKQDIAFVIDMFWHDKRARGLVLLYEKNSSKYEESASVTYEKLMDIGYKYAYFIIDRDYEYIDRIPEKYRKNIVYKHSFKHYLYFFRAKTFIGTEQLVHAIDLKTFNVLALKKISDRDLNFIFLQHGVMYMVSLDSESRGMFSPKKLDKKYRVVVSSKAEADHFIELGRHKATDLYITGLPKFDRNRLSDDADKIVIMPTWRPWEINLARNDFKQTAYFKMVMKLYNSVPDDLKEKVVILPHPLIVNELENIEMSIADKVLIGARYDDVLQQTRLLITDYSSIAYDAFYRGSRVIFYWEEKDYCMQQYGPSTKLMLNEENVYGDYFYDTNGLSDAIEYNYNNPQKELHRKNYSGIVQFHDGNNTQRLVDALIEDDIIKL